MSNNFLLVIILMFIFNINGYSQSPLKISTSRNNDKSIDFNYTKTEPGTFFVEVNIKGLKNSNDSEKQTTVVTNFIGKLFTIKPSDGNQNISFETYSTKLAYGNPNLKVNENYLLLAL